MRASPSASATGGKEISLSPLAFEWEAEDMASWAWRLVLSGAMTGVLGSSGACLGSYAPCDCTETEVSSFSIGEIARSLVP